MSLPEKVSVDLNPIIGNIPADTLINISSILELSQDLITQSECLELSKKGTSGMFVINCCVKAALDYEIGNRSNNLVRSGAIL